MYSEHQWILFQATDKKQLVTEGTLQSALYKKIDDVLLPILAEMISFMDQNYNLDLVTGESTVLSLWNAVFATNELCKFTFDRLFPEKVGKVQNPVPGVGSRRAQMDFRSQYPFSWIIKDHVDTILAQAVQLAGMYTAYKKISTQVNLSLHFLCGLGINTNRSGYTRALYLQLSSMIQTSSVGRAIVSATIHPGEVTSLAERYLHDFVILVYSSKQRDTKVHEIEV